MSAYEISLTVSYCSCLPVFHCIDFWPLDQIILKYQDIMVSPSAQIHLLVVHFNIIKWSMDWNAVKRWLGSPSLPLCRCTGYIGRKLLVYISSHNWLMIHQTQLLYQFLRREMSSMRNVKHILSHVLYPVPLSEDVVAQANFLLLGLSDDS